MKRLSVIFYMLSSLTLMPALADEEVSRSDRHYANGTAYVSQGNMQYAIEEYDAAIIADPKNVKAYNNRGLCYLNLKQYGNAQKDFEAALKIDPKFVQAVCNLGAIYSYSGQFDLALRQYERGVEIDPSFALAYSNCGNIYLIKEQWQKALDAFSRAIELDQTLAQVYLKRACIYLDHLNQADLAMADLDRAAALNPYDARIFIARGDIFSIKGKSELAKEQYLKARALDPGFIISDHRKIPSSAPALKEAQLMNNSPSPLTNGLKLNNLDLSSEKEAPSLSMQQPAKDLPSDAESSPGQLEKPSAEKLPNPSFDQVHTSDNFSPGRDDIQYYQQLATNSFAEGDYQRAVQASSKGIGCASSNAVIYNIRGASYLKLHKNVEALADLNRAIAIAPNFLEALVNRAIANDELGHFGQALADCAMVKAINPKFAAAYSTCSSVLLHQEKFAEAITECNRAIKLDPQNADAFCNKGTAEYGLKHFTEAANDCSQAIKLNSENIFAYCIRAGSLIEQSKYADCINDCETALRFDSRLELAYRFRGTAYYYLGKYNEALADLNQGILIDPVEPALYYFKSLCLEKMGKHDLAVEDLARAFRLGYKQ